MIQCIYKLLYATRGVDSITKRDIYVGTRRINNHLGGEAHYAVTMFNVVRPCHQPYVHNLEHGVHPYGERKEVEWGVIQTCSRALICEKIKNLNWRSSGIHGYRLEEMVNQWIKKKKQQKHKEKSLYAEVWSSCGNYEQKVRDLHTQ